MSTSELGLCLTLVNRYVSTVLVMSMCTMGDTVAHDICDTSDWMSHWLEIYSKPWTLSLKLS